MEDENDILSSDALTFSESGIPAYKEIEVPDLLDVSQINSAEGTRLMITKIVNENFKSYAGVKTLGPFHKNFTAIIGPNGSGKSNIIDSMLFVFGYRASKIRSKKIGVLIHNSETNSHVESCTVSVHFQKIIEEGSGEDEFKVVEGSQFSVSRTAFRDNSSHYKIDNRKVQFREVESFLSQVGVDLVHNRFLILQGEVEQIAMMKPMALSKNDDGMLEFLEDIIGSRRFKLPIEMLSRRVDELTNIHREKHLRMKMAEKEKNNLEVAKNEAIAYLELENEITQKRSILVQKEISSSEKLYTEAVERKTSTINNLQTNEQQLAKTISQKKGIANENKEILKKFNEIDALHEKVKREFRDYEQRDRRCQEDQKHCRNNAKNLVKSLQQEQTKLAEYKMKPDMKTQDAKKLSDKLQVLQADKQKEEERFNEVMNSFQDETKELQQQKEKMEKQLLEHQKAVNVAKQQYQLKQAELDLMKSNHTKESAKMADMSRNLGRLKTMLEEKNSSLEEVNQNFPTGREALEKAKKDFAEVNKVLQEKEDKVKQLRMKVEVARSNYQSSQNQNRVLNYLMNLKRSGRIPGIYGRLGDLGAIDAKYDVAVSTACGVLDHIVVDNMDTAQKCIEALKEGSVGQAKFIGVDKMEVWRGHCSRRVNAPESVPRIFDLIKVKDDRILPTFYYGVRDTLIAKDLDQASRIAYGSTRYRVVTLGGQLIDLSGTMSGGGNKVIQGKMGSKLADEVDPRELEKMERELDKTLNELNACMDNRHKLQDAVDKMQKSHRDMQHSMQKLSNEIKNIEEQCSSFEKQLKDQEIVVASSIPNEKKLKEMEDKVADLKKDYEKLQKVASDLEDEIHEIHKQIMEIGGRELKSIETRMSLLNTEINQINNALAELSVTIKTAQRNVVKSEVKVESLTKEIDMNKERMIELEKEEKNIEAEAQTVLANLSKSEEDKITYEKLLSEASAKTSTYDKEEQELKKQQIQLKHKLDKAMTDEVERKERVDDFRRMFEELVLNPINEGDNLELILHPDEELNRHTVEQIKYDIATLQSNLSKIRPNMSAIEEFKKKEEIHKNRMMETKGIHDLLTNQRESYDGMKKRRLNEFMDGFGQIANKLKEMYQMITLGGDAELELVDSLDPFSEGIVFSVRPPMKSWKNISNLSGGEKTLSSLALVFALHHYKPTPFYVMDEIDAALDFRNVSIVAHYIKDRTKNAQFIVISLRNNMYELCDRLLGIYKTNNCTNSVMVNPKLAAIKKGNSKMSL